MSDTSDDLVCGARLEFKRKIINYDDRKVIDIPLELEEALHIKSDEEVKIASLLNNFKPNKELLRAEHIEFLCIQS
jgi:hypothetical protein